MIAIPPPYVLFVSGSSYLLDVLVPVPLPFLFLFLSLLLVLVSPPIGSSDLPDDLASTRFPFATFFGFFLFSSVFLSFFNCF
jgi:hypothetical protein